MKSKVSSILFFCFIAFSAAAQHRLSGVVRSEEDSVVVNECVVYLNGGTKSAPTDKAGRFVFEDLANGKYTLHFTGPGYKYSNQEVIISNNDAVVRSYLTPFRETLQEVMITDASDNFGVTRMRAVENLGIYEGKKSEVIVPEKLVANLATNNARQVYSRVAGLNIWENDGAGIQLSIGGRGLDPNRTANFNVRQNGYDISADALGYPESYYTPPTEGIGKIQIVRGAASLQYGTQFGGLINFSMKKPVPDKKLELSASQTVGSYGFYNAFTSVSGTVNKLSYYTFFQYKRGDGWRKNSQFDNHTFYANINYAINPNTSIGIDVTKMGYLAQQPGGLTDGMFLENARQTNRERNWFKVNWNLFALHIDHKFNATSEFNARVFSLFANRYAVGFRPNRVAMEDDNSERDLIKGDFENWGAEVRYLKRYQLSKIQSVLLVGARYYHGFNHSTQGFGSKGANADFNYITSDEAITYDYRFPNKNAAVFLENILYINDKLSLTPGIRFEHINTVAEGYYGWVSKDLAGNIIDVTRFDEKLNKGRQFLLAGLGVSYKATPFIDIYSNISQNYRSITFNDMRISNPSAEIDPNLEDEKGYSVDLGVRSEQTALFNYDVSLFYLNYDNRIGEILVQDKRRRGNIGHAVIQGVEAYGEGDLIGLLHSKETPWTGILFGNVAFIGSEYKSSQAPGITGKKVEFVPSVNLKTGVRVGYKNLKGSFQYTYLSQQYSDATNAEKEVSSAAVGGTIPSYYVMDVTLSYTFKKFGIETSVNNLTNNMYYTRRATGYPGPGILPSDGRTFFVTLKARI
ncbi:TonB-dependent receptor [Chryseolinea sp. H1M3-3]|uniref:TonB-dependent receptor n=1 Tax=Chryseolinea sp. H1M3-3 TaxID=3034144 RepID=UPI0023EB3CFD|nr:TonB-dependent receptor [Chryseolinea sp. H1M3-3]